MRRGPPSFSEAPAAVLSDASFSSSPPDASFSSSSSFAAASLVAAALPAALPTASLPDGLLDALLDALAGGLLDGECSGVGAYIWVRREEVDEEVGGVGSTVFTCSPTMATHLRSSQLCLRRFGPPKRGLSRQLLHVPQSSVLHAAHLPQRTVFLGLQCPGVSAEVGVGSVGVGSLGVAFGVSFGVSFGVGFGVGVFFTGASFGVGGLGVDLGAPAGCLTGGWTGC